MTLRIFILMFASIAILYLSAITGYAKPSIITFVISMGEDINNSLFSQDVLDSMESTNLFKQKC